ncbi:hypothetical protein BIW11_12637 [Tropilaelaps mercedesae]|uniref:PDZ domain-containing protein n=1 Tax=Tropilaelaps mercedesae TaxID=418985 RepID=A0A1V9X618_9ACAR|nr:hypothetical protein BIW11_12637 [Tropilaelaps mercedesae]
MRIFSLQEWKSLWNLNKPPKVHPSIRNPDHFYSVNANLSHGSLPAIPRYGIKSYESYPGYVVDEVDSLSASARGRASQQGSRRAGSSLPSSARRARRGPLNAKVAPISRDQGEETYLQLKDDQTCIGYNANGMVDTRRTSGEPRATSSPVHEASKEHGKNIRPFPAGEMKPPTTQPVTHVRDDASPDDTNAVIYSTVQKNPSGKPKQLQQVSLAQPSWHKSRSQRELSSSGDDWAENANRYKQTHVNNRSLAKEPLKNWDHNRSGYSTAEGKSTEENTSRHYNPAKRSYMESLYDLDGNQSRSMKFSEAQKKFQQLANASQDQPTSQHNPPRKTGFATRLNCSIEPCNVSIQTRFNSQQDVTEKVTVNELYKSAAALPLTSENHTSVDAQYDYPRRSFEVVTKSGTEIQQRDSLYRWANSSGLPENDFNSQTLSPQRCRAQSTKVLGNLSTGSSTGSSLALLREERQFAKAEPDGAPSIGNPKDSPDDGPITSTPRTSARKALRPLTNSQENLVSRHQGNERTDWQEADILIRRQPERGDFGFAIIGGRDQKVRSNDKGVYVAEIYTGGSAALDGRLKVI